MIDGSMEETEKGEVRTPVKDYQVLYNELKMYKDGILLQKPSLIVVNKCDRKYVNFKQKYERLKKIAHAPMMPISAKEGENLEQLLETLKEIIEHEKARIELQK